jgi:hypothetical protein
LFEKYFSESTIGERSKTLTSVEVAEQVVDNVQEDADAHEAKGEQGVVVPLGVLLRDVDHCAEGLE